MPNGIRLYFQLILWANIRIAAKGTAFNGSFIINFSLAILAFLISFNFR